MSIEVAYSFDGVNFALYLNFVRLHGFLNSATNFSQPSIYACFSNSCIGGILDCLQKFVISGVKGNSECAVNNSAFYVGAEIYLADIVICENSVISKIRSIMGGYVIEGASSWKGNA
jgi:hypothetical protein